MDAEHREWARDSDWLDAEHHGREDAAELAFARLIAELPPIQPSPDFVARTVHVAWRVLGRRRLTTRLARAAAVSMVAAASLALTYVVGVLAAGALVRGTVVSAHGLVWMMMLVGQGVRWWSIAERLGLAASQTITAPQTTVVMVALELLVAMAVYVFQRVLRDDGAADSGKVRT